jgi:hypothetical protein
MSAAGREWAEGFFEKLLRETMHCHRAEVLTIVEGQAADCDAAEAAPPFRGSRRTLVRDRQATN